ncbi:MarR family winged helix-turn-helix transcriptional regulator [Nonomuraea sp. 3-1Str]|uniref:MarR family winged helix-turn-helix transcriptional regulator n=1 Tax=Nonomuraea sp. 3-1Str TaxID=2929801 RepID=UPI002854FC4E|nr:MarR family winged helix-turn-helix transcriptional regulator [Nonomuraea sp. 3-1Str]MDR8410080.1 MarR family winged helix-turn-helix transcriptional regulator [Nonomuraea sp. 3-1Str]
MERNGDEHVETVERAMVAIRRSQTRRNLARLAAARQTTGSGADQETAAIAAPGGGAEILDVIEEAEEGGDAATVSSVAAALNIDQPRASKLVAAAVTAGLVRREADQADGRRALLVRTPAGRRVSARIHAFRQEMYAEAMRDWPAADRAEFARLLAGFVESLGTITR